jgi:FtsH-binding integral membrane protein
MRPVRTVFQQVSDIGLQSYLLRIYQYMGLGLALTGVVAYIFSMIPPRQLGSLPLLSCFGALGISFFFHGRFLSIKASTAQLLFWLYAGLMGICTTTFVSAYHMHSIATAFFLTACTFGIMTVYGHTTQRDLTSVGSFCMMGVIGLLVVGVVNLFLRSSMMHFVMSLISVGLFTALIAYQTQSMRYMYYAMPQNQELRLKMSIAAALSLYASVLQIFLSLLNLMGERK